MLRRMISILLVTALILTLVPVMGFAAQKASSEDVFDAIDQAIEAASHQRSVLTDAGKTQLAKAAVEKLGIKTEAHGDGCFLFTVDGEPCMFNAHTYNILSQMQPLEGYVDDGQVVTVDYSKRSNGPDAKDVYLIEPFYGTDSSFTRQYQNEASSVAAATGGTYTLYKTRTATIDVIADALESGGVVFFDSHGDTDYYETPDRGDYVSKANTSYLLIATGTGITSADKASARGDYGTYNHTMSYDGYYYVDGTAITNHMEKDAPNNLVWMAICLGMATDGLEKPFREHGVGVVYGYSQSVTFDGDYDYEATFWTNMKNGKDVKTAIAAMKSKHGNWDPGMGCSTISKARSEYAAFPIVVSDLDAYPGHGNVDNYQTVNSDWELFGSSVKYNITAVSAQPACGSVSLSGQTVTATPNEGYAVGGCTVEPADACTVTQNGNTFVLSGISADCTVTVSFVPRTPATVSFSVPNGVICDDIDAYVGDTVTLPKPEGTPIADRYDYSFVGWTTDEVSDTESKPSYLPAGSELTLSADTTLFALYTYSVSAEGDGAVFCALQDAASDYSGDYVIGYQTDCFLDASGAYTGSAIGGKNAAISQLNSGATVRNGALYNVPDRLIYQISLYDRQNNTYTIRMKNSETYLYHTLLVNSLSTTDTASKSGAQWQIIADGSTFRLKNASTGKYLEYNTANSYFRCYNEGAQADITLYCGGRSTSYYTTQLQSQCAHVWTTGTITLDATCTQEGTVRSECTLCGAVRLEAIPALGHAYDAVITAPTCTEGGYTTYTCSRCGDHYTAEETEALGHEYQDGICTVCGAEDPSYIPPTEPTETEPIVTEPIEPTEPQDPCEGYTDIDRNAWYHPYADFAIEHALMGSTNPDILTFEPTTSCTRAMIVTILYRLAGQPAVVYEERFPDVAEEQWFTSAVIWAYQNGVVSGYDTGLFGTNDKITREQLAVILKAYSERIMGLDTSSTADLSAFADTSKVTWSKPYISWAVAEGLISGKAQKDGLYLDPQGSASRAEVATILMKYLSE